MKRIFQNIRAFVNRVYRLSLGYKKQESALWKELKKFHFEAGWKAGVFEADKYIELIFPFEDDTPANYRYLVLDGELQCLVKVLDGFRRELATDVFVLASHFNNLLRTGAVEIDVNSSSVYYRVKKDMLVPLLYTGEIYEQLRSHHATSQDIYWAYQKLVVDNEEPALIIADLMKKRDEREAQSETEEK